MTTQLTIRKEVQMLRQALLPKREDIIIVRMWIPEDDPRHKMTDDQIIRANQNSRIIVLPQR